MPKVRRIMVLQGDFDKRDGYKPYRVKGKRIWTSGDGSVVYAGLAPKVERPVIPYCAYLMVSRNEGLLSVSCHYDDSPFCILTCSSLQKGAVRIVQDYCANWCPIKGRAMQPVSRVYECMYIAGQGWHEVRKDPYDRKCSAVKAAWQRKTPIPAWPACWSLISTSSRTASAAAGSS